MLDSLEVYAKAIRFCKLSLCPTFRDGYPPGHRYPQYLSKDKYGNMYAFVMKLEDCGYEQVELVPTDKGKFMSPVGKK